MKISGLSHIGLPTADLEASKRFYEKLGFRQLVKKENENGYNYVYMENGSCIIGLPQRIIPAEAVAEKRPPQGAIDHLALCCEDIDAVFEMCVSQGMKILSNGIESNEIWKPKSCRCFMVEAPDGVRLEFQEMR